MMEVLNTEFAHSDDRRTLLQLLTADIKQVNLYQAKKSARLGNHFHKETTEYFYIVKGSVLYNNKTTLSNGQIFVVKPQEHHLLECMTDVTLMTFLTKPYTKEKPDIWTKIN